MSVRIVRRLAITLVIATIGIGTTVVAVHQRLLVGVQPDGRILVPNGQTLTPAGTHVLVNDRPLGMVVSPDGNLLAVVTGSNFNPRALHLIDLQTRTLKQTIAIANSFVGVAFNPAGDTIYVGGGPSNDVKIFKATGGVFAAAGTIPISGGPQPSGLTLDADGTHLYVALNQTHEVAVIDTATRSVARVKVGIYPYTAVISADGTKVYVSNWGGKVPGPADFTDGQNPVIVDRRTGIPVTGTVSVLDTASRTILKHIDVGLHPTGMALSPSGDRLYVTNANSDTVSVIDTTSDTVARTLQVGERGPERRAVLGSAPNAIAVSPDGQTLFVANAAQNAIAVVDAFGRSDDAVRGLIPTGWYPTAVALSAAGDQLFVGSGYGFGSIAATPASRDGRSFVDRAGVVSLLDVPDRQALRRFTDQVRENNRSLPPQADDEDEHADGRGEGQGNSNAGHGGGDDGHRGESGRRADPIPDRIGEASPIKHVFYIIKENRTYDQVLGDLPQANGDPSLVEFGRTVSPNHHALVEQFAVLDNYYGPGDQSALGHRWVLQSYPSDWVHKYGNGRNNQNPMLLGPTDAIYDHAKAHGLTVRAYGERGANTITPANATWTDIYSDWKFGTHNVDIAAQAIIVGLRDVYHPRYPAAESRVPDQYRADIFLKEFAEFEKNGNLPSLVLLLLYDDHTEGTSPGFPTPRAQVADNDLALGRIVDAISHSRYWKESAIFVTEDDSQDGLDHVDGHRTVGMAISPYVKHGRVDSHFFSIVNVFRTIEQILGLPPLNGFDSPAEPMFSVFTSKPDFTPYTARPNQIPLDEMNPGIAGLVGLQRQLAKFSLTIDSSEPDSADADLLNRAIWHSVKGFDTPYNYGRPIVGRHPSFESLLQQSGR
ncbi:MAG TPA: bifunctional YncE family protein/alkaline phosphatase family protein [Vicinamibacterales bacterium]|nr:bifunctional YncE family protein/alkaline phosphatase family protein [Vicinamibacterales bacterium]